MKNLSGDERKLLLIQFFNFLSYSLVGVFVTVFFYRHSDLKTTILYNMINMGFFTIFYLCSGWMLRKISSGFLMKLSFLVAAIFYFFLFFLREQSVVYILPLGIISGFSGAAFWSAFNLNQYILTHSGRRVEYFGWGSALVNLANAFGPVIGGWLISFVAGITLSLTTGYVTLFLLVFLIMICAVIIIGKLPSHGMPEFSYRHLWQHQRSRRWKLVLTWQAIFGLYDVAIGTVTSVLFYLAVGKESTLGFLLTIAALVSTAASLLSIRVLKKFPNGFWIGAVGTAFAIGWFALFQNLGGVWVYLILSSFTGSFLFTPMAAEYFNAVDAAAGKWQNKYHLILEQPVLFCTMRTISYVVLFFLLQLGDEITIARLWLLFLPVLPITIGLLLHKSMSLQSVKKEIF